MTTETSGLEVHFRGVRGSHPVCGQQFAWYGGDTPCVEVLCDGQRFIVDAGSGIVGLGQDIVEACPLDGEGASPAAPPAPADDIHILLSHLHHDHIAGLPFFRPALCADRTIHTWCGNLDGASAADALDVMYQPPLFPVKLEQLPASFIHHGFHAGETIEVAGVSVRTCLLNHPSGSTGYRFDCGGHAICYVSDIEHAPDAPPADLLAFVAGADLVIYDSMFLEEEYCRCIGWGHSTWREGVRLCQLAGAKAMAMFHLHPARDDDMLRAIEKELAAALPGSFIARSGLRVRFDAAA